MIINWLALICMLLTVQFVTATDLNGHSFLEHEHKKTLGFVLYGTDIFGVHLEKEVYIGQFHDDFENLTEIARIPLDQHVYNDEDLLEFKLINKSSVFTCTRIDCSVCSLSTNSLPNCLSITLSPNYRKLRSVSAALTNNDIILRTVDEGDYASIHYLSSDKNYEDSGRRSIDADIFSNFETVAGFSTETHTYFIGSAKRLDLPRLPLKEITTRSNSDIRITRICNNDKTDNLASRIGLVLSCNGINYNNDWTLTNRATAAFYLPESSKLLVAFRHGRFAPDMNSRYKNRTEIETYQNIICSYNFTSLQSRFTETWDKCQRLSKAEGNYHNCKKRKRNLIDLDDECFLFSWDNYQRQSYCSVYNEAMGDAQLDNCELHTINKTTHAYGSLENFKPYKGNLVFQKIDKHPIVAIRQLPNQKDVYALIKDSGLLRIHEPTSKRVFGLLARHGKHLLEVIPKSSKVLFLEKQLFKDVMISFSSSCEGIYKTCHSIYRDDPLNCRNCVNEDGSSYIVSENVTCPNNTTYQHFCPSIILGTMKQNNGDDLIIGIGLEKLFDREPILCDSQCNLAVTVTSKHISCITIPFLNDTCIVKINGSFDSAFYNVTFPKGLLTYHRIPVQTNIWKFVVFASTLVILHILICFIYICISRLKDKSYVEAEPDIPLIPIPEQLNINSLVILKTKTLGSGVSAVVYKGSYKTSASDNEPVAVKILNNEYALLVNTAELIDELKVLSRVHHSNIVAFIGYSYIDRTLHIVTEYMAGGSLYSYIKDGSIQIKYQHAFDYMDQILSAMVYLSEQQIVHRDLAARNCLLNHDYTVLKVSDFGLARSVDFKGEYQILHDNALPTRWIAIEAFSLRKFTEKTDVWSFGVLVWELFTRGDTPYYPLDHFQILIFLNQGRRLQCPQTCPDQIYALMITCWDGEPRKRPNFKQLQKDLKDRIRHLTNVNKQLIETGYERPNN